MRKWGQVGSRGSVSSIPGSETSIPSGARDGFRIRTTSAQSVNGGANVVWHSDSASFGCFNVGAFWASGTPEVAVLPLPTEDVEWYIFTLCLRIIPGESITFFPNEPSNNPGHFLEAGIFASSKVFHSSGMFSLTPASTLAQRTFSVRMGSEYNPPFTVDGAASSDTSFWSIMRLR